MRDDAALFGVSALEASMSFDELALLQEHASYLSDKLRVPVAVSVNTDLASPDHKGSAELAQPGKPAVHYHIDKSSGKAPGGGKAAGGGKVAGGGDKGVTNGKSTATGSKFSAISDLAKLNEHLSGRSYMEGGAAPTAADMAQLTATPSNVSAEKFPHVARWYSHISFFTPAQQARW